MWRAKVAATILVVLLLVLLTLGYQRYNEPITLSVPACGIEVECEEVFTPRSARLQAVIDKPGTAAWYGKYILDHAGQITSFPEPSDTTGYQRIECQMDAAAAGVKKNGSQNLEWPAPNEGQSYGQATHIGIFSAKMGGTPLGAIPLSAVVTLGLKNTLIIYKGKFTASMTVTDAAATETA